MNAKKLVTWAAIGLILFLLISRPAESAGAVHTVLDWLKAGAEAIITFIRSLFR